ncbi:TIMELESS-interacting protein-like isoform X2 [Ostrea edulis]|uniref:TIMELESS-interacting protein-like isoform X2 n=1 Tax=Ostrea edulis TaxID=37623 RepID=UPI0024AFB56A|nr:TIMELESS-interacting protein-like isoform X2 [Ostrea edulis]
MTEPFTLKRLLKRKNMESVDLDMDDIFEEEELPSVGPLPDLPQDDEGLENTQNGEEYEENSAEVLSRLKDLSKGAAKKVVRRPQPKLDASRLTGERGIPILPKVFQDVKFKGKGHEAGDLQIIMRYLEHWAHRLFPKMPFDEVLERIEKLGTKNEVKTCIKRMRLDMPILNDDFVRDGSDNEEESGQISENIDVDAEEAWEEMIAEEKKKHSSQQNGASPPSQSSQETPQGGMLAAQLSQPLSSTPSTSGSSTMGNSRAGVSQGLTPEQRDRLEKNRMLAMERRANKQGGHVFKTPAIPKSPARRLVSHTVSSPSQASPSILQSPPKMCSHGTIPINNPHNQPTFHSLVTANSSQDTCTLVNSSGSNIANGSLQNDPIRGSVTTQDSDMSEVIPFVSVNKILDNQSDSSDMSQTIPLLKSPPKKCGELNSSSSDHMSEEELLLHLSESE